jgi:macrolide-specific efflux system membrane fusion protein
VSQAQAQVAQAQVNVTAAEADVAATTLTAPIAGTVTAVTGSVGDTVSGGSSSVSRASSAGAAAGGAGAGGSSSTATPFVTIDTVNALQIVSGFAESDVSKIAVGQPATITFSALPNTQVAGRVTAVSATSTVVSNVVTYDDTVSLVNPPKSVKQGMTANVSVVVQSRAGVLQLPSAAITTTGPVSTVSLLVNGEPVVTPITIGLVGSSSTEIVRGLKAGDVVVVPTVDISAATTSSTTGPGGGFGGGLGGGFGGGRGGFAGGGGG